MGTRGILAFAHDGKIKATYNHFDSYPSWLGKVAFEWLAHADLDKAIEQFDRLTLVDENVPPTDDQKLALLRYFDPNVSTRSSDDWYSLLRETQGNPQAILDAGYYFDGLSYGGVEWGYLIDLDANDVKVYPGWPYNDEDPWAVIDVEDILTNGADAIAEELEEKYNEEGDW